jgi:hypothetical protein
MPSHREWVKRSENTFVLQKTHIVRECFNTITMIPCSSKEDNDFARLLGFRERKIRPWKFRSTKSGLLLMSTLIFVSRVEDTK